MSTLQLAREKKKEPKEDYYLQQLPLGAPLKWALLTLSAELKQQNVEKEPPVSAAVGGQLDPGWHLSLTGCHEETNFLGHCRSSLAASNVSAPEVQHHNLPLSSQGVLVRSNTDLGK